MKETIKKYFEKLKQYPNYYKYEDFDKVSNEIKKKFAKGLIPVERKDESDISLFEKEFGYKLPDEIVSYINIFWHPYISGYYNGVHEAIVLFPVLKKEGDSCDDILFYKNGLITMSKDWEKIGNVKKYIPIGWLGYSGGCVLYEVRSKNIFLEKWDIDGEVEAHPIAGSLKELINNLAPRDIVK